MTERDLFFLVMFVILLGTLTVWIVQLVRSRRRRGDGSGGDERTGWWEGPWDEDERKG